MEMEITVDLFHVSFGIMRQLFKDLPRLWSQQNHSNSPIWASSESERGLLLEVARELLDSVMMKQHSHDDGDQC